VTDWSPLADRDPIPGDPFEVRAVAAHFARVGAETTHHASTLGRIDSGAAWQGVAANAFDSLASQLRRQLDQVGLRYTAIAEALKTYAPRLEQAQIKARRALARAHEAHARLTSAEQARLRESEARCHPRSQFIGPPSTTTTLSRTLNPSPVQVHQRYDLVIDDARAELAAARRLLDEAVHDRDGAAHSCARHIGHAVDDPLKDPDLSFRGRLKDKIVVTARVVSSVCGTISAWAGVLALATSWVPVVGEVVGAIALVTSVAALTADVVLAVAGDGSWGDVAISATGLALGGVGKVAGNAAKAAASAKLIKANRASAQAGKEVAKSRETLTTLSAGSKPATDRSEALARQTGRLRTSEAGIRTQMAKDSLPHMGGHGVRGMVVDTRNEFRVTKKLVTQPGSSARTVREFLKNPENYDIIEALKGLRPHAYDYRWSGVAWRKAGWASHGGSVWTSKDDFHVGAIARAIP
jgi:hypothetical protein